PTEHLRDLRSELLLKLVLADIGGVDSQQLIVTQREKVARIAAVLDEQLDRSQPERDVVTLWRSESARGALRFLDRLIIDA
ncbi:MAG: PadR family transcriptional regulator, partial [Acidimicrobiales bacterium]|nr:PadR family transcriptional regulator [Acidimicrobiales bacterium]